MASHQRDICCAKKDPFRQKQTQQTIAWALAVEACLVVLLRLLVRIKLEERKAETHGQE